MFGVFIALNDIFNNAFNGAFNDIFNALLLVVSVFI